MGIIEDWNISIEELNQILSTHSSIRGILSGFIAEYKSARLWFSDARIHTLRRDGNHDRRRPGDLGFTCQGVPISVQVKSLQSKTACSDVVSRTTIQRETHSGCWTKSWRRENHAGSSEAETNEIRL
jgi:hypothetical protein